MTQRIPEDVRGKVDSIYVADNDRFVVSLIVGYSDDDLDNDENEGYAALSDEEKALVAARWALALTTDEGSHGTQWHVLDRQTGETYTFEQEDFAGEDDGW